MIHTTEPSSHLDGSVLADIRALGGPDQDVLADVLTLFVAEVPDQLCALERAIDTHDVDRAWQIAHRVKGTALGIGAWQMATFAGMVEYAARAEALDRAASHMAELAAEIDATRLALEREVC